MSFVHVHTPLFSSPEFVNVSRGGRFGDNVEEMDHSVGQIIAALDEAGVANVRIPATLWSLEVLASRFWRCSRRTLP